MVLYWCKWDVYGSVLGPGAGFVLRAGGVKPHAFVRLHVRLVCVFMCLWCYFVVRWVQVGGFAGLGVCLLLWIVQFFELGLHPHRLPAVGTGLGSVLSVVVRFCA